MGTKNNQKISFQISKIETLQFAVFQPEFSDEDKLSLSVNFCFGVIPTECLLLSSVEYTFLSKKAPILKLEVSIAFRLEEECFKKEIHREKQWFIPKNFAIHLAMIVVGTARGILHEKTRDTPLNNYPMPPINVEGSIKDDIAIDRRD